MESTRRRKPKRRVERDEYDRRDEPQRREHGGGLAGIGSRKSRADLYIKLIMRRRQTARALRIIPFYVEPAASLFFHFSKKKKAPKFGA